jgi:hypothetical protein
MSLLRILEKMVSGLPSALNYRTISNVEGCAESNQTPAPQSAGFALRPAQATCSHLLLWMLMPLERNEQGLKLACVLDIELQVPDALLQACKGVAHENPKPRRSTAISVTVFSSSNRQH